MFLFTFMRVNFHLPQKSGNRTQKLFALLAQIVLNSNTTHRTINTHTETQSHKLLTFNQTRIDSTIH